MFLICLPPQFYSDIIPIRAKTLHVLLLYMSCLREWLVYYCYLSFSPSTSFMPKQHRIFLYPHPQVIAKFIYSSWVRLGRDALLLEMPVFLQLSFYFLRMLTQLSVVQFDFWHEKTDRQKSESGIQLGKCLTFPVRPLKYDWTGLKKVLGFNLSRKVFSKLFLTIWVWYKSPEESAVPA